MSNLKLTRDAINGSITDESYYVFPGTTMTVCCLTVRGCLHLTGESDCIYPGDFDADKGRAAAHAKAMVKVWDQAAIDLKLELHDDYSMATHLKATSGSSEC